MTTSPAWRRPTQSEYAEYYSTYINQVPDGDILVMLRQQMDATDAVLAEASDEQTHFRYEEGKWTLGEVVRHVIDGEWVFTNRALRFARGDETPLPGIDQDQLVSGVDSSTLKMDSLRAEFRYLRSANITMFEQLSDAALTRTGVASDCHFTVRAMLWIIAGHELHHRKVIQERYLKRR